MGDQRDQDFDQIIKGLEDMKKTIEEIRSVSSRMKMAATEAEGELKDPVAHKNLSRVKELAEYIEKETRSGQDTVDQLLAKKKSDKARYEELESLG